MEKIAMAPSYERDDSVFPELWTSDILSCATLSQRDIRSIVFHILYMAESHGYQDSPESVIETFGRTFKIDFSNSSVPLISKEVIEKRDQLDATIFPFLTNWKFDRVGVCTKLILRYALWELLYCETTPNIVINEAVELSKAFAEHDSYKFVNGLLDEFVKSRPNNS